SIIIVQSPSTSVLALSLCPWHSFFNDSAPPEIYPLSLHDALPILRPPRAVTMPCAAYMPATSSGEVSGRTRITCWPETSPEDVADRKSTRLNSSHQIISYAVFCLKKKKIKKAKKWD